MKNFKNRFSSVAKSIAAATYALMSLMAAPTVASAQSVDPANPWGFEKKAYKPDGTPWSGPVNVGDIVKYVLSYKPSATNSGPVTIDDTLSPNQSYVAPTTSSPGWTWGSSPYASGNHEQYVNPGFGPGTGSVKLTVSGVPAPSSGEGDGTAPIPIPSLNKVFGVFHHAEDMTTPKYQMKIGCWNLNDLNPCATPSANNGGLHTPIWPQAVVRGEKFFFPGILGGTVSGHAIVGPVAIGCFDGAVSPSGAACGTTLVGVNAGLGQFGGVVEDSSGNLLIAVLDRLYCFKEASGSLSTCPSWPGSGFVSVSPTPSSPTAWNNTTSQVYLLSDPTNVVGRVYVGHGSGVVQCVQTAGTPSLCPGWPVTGVQPAGASHGISLHSIPSGGGGDGGVCLWDIAGTLSGCVDANGVTIAASAPANVVAYVPIPFRFPNSNKVYFPSHNATHGPKCVSYAGASGTPCPGFTSAVPAGFPNKTLQYGVAIDPTKPEKCMLALGDESLLWRFDYTTGEPGCGTTTVSTPPIESLYCNGKPDSVNFKWTGFSVVTPGASGTLLVKQGSTTVYNGAISSSVTNFSLAAAGATPLTVTFIPAAGKSATVDVNFIYTSDKNPEICYQAKVLKCGQIVSNEAVMKGVNGATPINFSRKVNLGIAKGPDCDPKPPVSVSCLKGDAVVTCGKVSGTFDVTLTLGGNGGVIPTTAQISVLTPGVSIVSPASSYPVIGGKVKITLAGATPGQVIDFQMDGSSTTPDPKTGLSICCNGKISITIPKDLDCAPKSTIDITKLCDPAQHVWIGDMPPKPNMPANGYVAMCHIKVTTTGNVPNPISVSEMMSGTGTVKYMGSSDPWACVPPLVPGNSPMNCTLSGNTMTGPTDTSIINVKVTFTSADDLKKANNCAAATYNGAQTKKACDDFQIGEGTIKVEKKCSPAVYGKYPVGPAATGLGLHADCQITVTTTGPQTGAITVGDNLTGTGTVVNMNAPAPWACTTPNCTVNGAALNQTSSTTVISAIAVFANTGNALEAKNCAEVKVAGKPSGESCTGITVAEKGKLTVIKEASYNGNHITNVNFPIAVTCGGTTTNATFADGTPYVQTNIPVGTNCSVVEGAAPATGLCRKTQTEVWTTTYNPTTPVAATVAGATIKVRNILSCKSDESTIKVTKVCDPAKEVIGAINHYEAACKITVTTTGPQTALIVVNEAMSGGGTVTSAASSTTPAWNCNTANCSINGSALNQTASTSVIDVKVSFPSKGHVSESQNCAKLSVGQNPVAKPEGEACTKFTVEDEAFKLDVKKDCSGVVALTANGPWAGYCKITVTATGGPRPPVIAINDGISYANASNTPPIQMTNMQSVDPWVCGAPTNNGGSINCSISGNAFPANGTSTLDILVQVPIGVKSGEAQNCVNAIGDKEVSGQSMTAPLYSTPFVCAPLPGGKDTPPPSGDITLSVTKTCDPAVQTPGAQTATAQCHITVTGTGTLPPTITVIETLNGLGNSGNQITAMTSAQNWNYPPLPAADGVGSPLTISGADLTAAGGTSVIDVTVKLFDLATAMETQNCVEGAGADANGNALVPALGSAKVCVPLTATQQQKAPLVCDPATTTNAGDLCRCRFDNMNQTSDTSCQCKDGFTLKAGKGCVPIVVAPKCDGVTAQPGKDGSCVCLYRNMSKTSSASCGCGKGSKFIKGKGCVPIEPICKNGTKFNPARGRCEALCQKGQTYNVKKNRCDTPPPVCKRNEQFNPKTGKCVAKEPFCRPPYKYNAKINKCVEVVKPAGRQCPFPLVPNPLNGRCINPGVIIDLFNDGGPSRPPKGGGDPGPVTPRCNPAVQECG